jgi:hypothetical protein
LIFSNKIAQERIIAKMNEENENFNRVAKEQFKDEWAIALMQKGVIAKVSISRWRATSPLNAVDLGLVFDNPDTKKFVKKYIKFGNEKLFPPEILSSFNSLEAMTRQNLSMYGFKTVWGNFIPYKSFEVWYENNKEIEQKYYEAATELGNKYDSIIYMVRSDYRQMAIDVWKRMYPDSNQPTESFITDFVNKVINKIPPRNQIVSSFKYETTFFEIPLPSFIAEDIAKKKKIETDMVKNQHEAELEMKAKEAIYKDYEEKKKDLIDGFLDSTVSSMRNLVNELCDNVLESIGKKKAKNQDLTSAQRKKIVGFIDKINLINFQDDKKIENLLSELKCEVLKSKQYRNDETIEFKLKKISEEAQKEFDIKDFNPAVDYLEL